MDKFLITGGKPLHGTVAISGAKNSALPAMAAGLLTADSLLLHNIPMVRDIITMGKLLAYMGATVATSEFPAANYTIASPTINEAVAPYELVKTMRASILTLGPALARTGVARVSLLAMQVGMHPRAIGIRDVLRDLVRCVPVAVTIVPERLQPRRKLRRRRSCFQR